MTLYLALIKFERFEWAVEKATELGVTRIVPVEANRSEHGLFARRSQACGAMEADCPRSQRTIAAVAGAGDRRSDPLAGGVEAMLRRIAAGSTNSRGAKPLLDAFAFRAGRFRCVCLIGPEGGWIDAERRQFQRCRVDRRFAWSVDSAGRNRGLCGARRAFADVAGAGTRRYFFLAASLMALRCGRS